MQPDRLDDIKKRVEAYRADPGTTIDPGELSWTSAQVNILRNAAGDLSWLAWVVDYLMQERRRLWDAVDAGNAGRERVHSAARGFLEQVLRESGRADDVAADTLPEQETH
jgi:hypothetical protein